ncbi:MAG: peptide ABC transporter substrate-binding protein [Dehalococcoidales bacterium]|nr:peptide ABC transporter substrate-binding protein [Dehalococcoidales bacterium]
MKKTIGLLVLVTLLIGLIFGGCQPAPVVPTAAKGGVLNLYGDDPLTLDPGVSGDATSHSYITQIFNGLVRLNDNLEPVADIARDWQVSADGRTYTFNLRQDVRFHDGRGVKASDFKFSWERACNPAIRSNTAATYLGDIMGVADVIAGRAKEISGVKVINDYTLEVTIDAPKSYFLSKLTYPTSFVVDKSNVGTANWWQKPNGTGPFKLKEFQKESRIVLARNDDYHGQVALVNSIVFQILSGVPMNLYETGAIDVTTVYTNYIDKVTDKAGPYYTQMTAIPELSFQYIGFDSTKSPFDDVKVRQAFSIAVDKEKIAHITYRDMVQAAYGILPPGIPGFNQALIGLKYDVNKAKELLAASKYGGAANLPPITITTSGWGGNVSGMLEAVVNEWRLNLGVEVTIRQIEPQRFLYNLKEERDQMFMMGWIADYPHPQDFLDILFHTGMDNNHGEYSNAEVDRLLEQAATTADREASLKLYQQAEQMLVDDAACIPLLFGKNYYLIKPYVKGYQPNPMGIAELNKVVVEPH